MPSPGEHLNVKYKVTVFVNQHQIDNVIKATI